MLRNHSGTWNLPKPLGWSGSHAQRGGVALAIESASLPWPCCSSSGVLGRDEGGWREGLNGK